MSEIAKKLKKASVLREVENVIGPLQDQQMQQPSLQKLHQHQMSGLPIEKDMEPLSYKHDILTEQ